MDSPTLTKFRIISERDTVELQNKWAHDIKFTQLPSNGVDQCNNENDSSGEKNFIRVFGLEMAQGIDFSQTKFEFGKMRKIVARPPELNIITTPLAPNIFQDNLTKCISKIHKNVVIVSAFNHENQVFGCGISAFIEERVLYSIRSSINKLSSGTKFKIVIESSLNKKGIKYSDEFEIDSMATEKGLDGMKTEIQKRMVVEFNKSVAWAKRLVYVQRNLSVLDRFMRTSGWQP
jgi:hypothetical protein